MKEMSGSFGNRQPYRKIALLIGNAAYIGNPLEKTLNDARFMSEKLKSIGFEVIVGTDLNLEKMASYIDRFIKRIERDHLALFLFAGHGTQLRVRYTLYIGIYYGTVMLCD